jgi:hypothetical protein
MISRRCSEPRVGAPAKSILSPSENARPGDACPKSSNQRQAFILQQQQQKSAAAAAVLLLCVCYLENHVFLYPGIERSIAARDFFKCDAQLQASSSCAPPNSFFIVSHGREF